jgi:twinkle protein
LKYKRPNSNDRVEEGKHEGVFSYFESRKIDRSTVISFGAQIGYTKSIFFPNCAQKKPAVCFNYMLGGEHVRTKYKSREKDFTSDSGGMNVPFNVDSCIYSPYVIITEGEEECMVWHQCGKTAVISAPNGANENLEWLDNVYELLEDKLIYIAVDMDEPGLKLKNALSRRFDRDRTFIIAFPFKDANDTLKENGEDYLVHLFDTATPVPIPEIADIDNQFAMVRYYAANGYPQGAKTCLPTTDKYIGFAHKDLVALTGVPSSGKTTWLRWYMMNLAAQSGWKFGIFTFENPVDLWVAEAIEVLTGKKLVNCNEMEMESAEAFIRSHFVFFDISIDTDYSLSSILEIGKSMIKRKGVDCIVLDPWNYIAIDHSDSLTEDIGAALRNTKKFCNLNDVAVIAVAHPRKMDKDGNGNYKVPTPYDIQNSNAWFNTPDFCLAVGRNYMDDYAPVDVYVQKAKYKFRGGLGSIQYTFDPSNSRYTELGMQNNTAMLNRSEQGVLL